MLGYYFPGLRKGGALSPAVPTPSIYFIETVVASLVKSPIMTGRTGSPSGQQLPLSQTCVSKQEAGGEGGLQKTRNEGGSHDVIDNKGPAWGTHDVYENKGT